MESSAIDQLALESSAKASLRKFVESWDSHGGLVVFVGAGFSAFQSERRPGAASTLKFGTWSDLANDFAKELSNGDEQIKRTLPADPLRLAELYQMRFGRTQLHNVIERHLPTTEFQPGPAHRRLRDLPLAALVTSNYDDLLERTFMGHRSVRCCIDDGDLTKLRGAKDLQIVKMHGDLERPGSIVITEEDYRIYDSKVPGVALKVRQLLLEYPVLFLGFSLDDPNFVRIDGWIRDTVDRLKIRSMAIVHGSIFPGAEAMWDRRNIGLLSGPDDRETMAQLLAAMTQEWRRHRDAAVEPPRFNMRVHDLKRRIADLTAGNEPDPQEVASYVGQLVDGAATDLDRGAAACDEARWFAYGWHNVLRSPFETTESNGSPPLLISLRDIYAALQPAQQIRLLMLILEAGEFKLRFSPGDEIDVVAELSKKQLPADEVASMHLYRARAHRERGESDAAERAISDGRELPASVTTRTSLTIEHRELLFLRGNAELLQNALAPPLDDCSDCLAVCRRGSDYLLLGDPESARQWYENALKIAINGEQRYVALWGQYVAAYPDGHSPIEEEKAFWREIRSIRLEDHSAIAAIEGHFNRAAKRALSPGGEATVVESLLRHLEALRHLGWPHTGSHHMHFEAEIAAANAAHWLLRDPTRDGRGLDRIKEALTLLNVYGLATKVDQLFGQEHLESLALSSVDIDWFRNFVDEAPSLPRPRDARLTTAICGIPLLTDDQIDRIILRVDEQATAWLDRKVQNDDLIPIWWKQVARHSEHLPKTAATRLLHLANRAARDPWATRHLEPHAIFGALSLWKLAGFLDVGLADAFVGLAEEVFRSTSFTTDWRWLNCVLQLLKSGIEADILSGSDCERLIRAIDTLFEGPMPSGEKEFAWLLTMIQATSKHLNRFAEKTIDWVRSDLRSSALGSALEIAVRLIPSMTDAHKADLLNLIESNPTPLSNAPFFDRGHVVRVLCALAMAIPGRRTEILARVGELLQQDPRLYGPHVDLTALFPSATAESLSTVRMLLSLSKKSRRRCLRPVAQWIASLRQDAIRDEVLDMLLGLLSADDPETRCITIKKVAHVVFEVAVADELRRPRVVSSLQLLVSHDNQWLVRGEALLALGKLSQTDEEVARLRELANETRNANVALLRRVADICLAPTNASS